MAFCHIQLFVKMQNSTIYFELKSDTPILLNVIVLLHVL